MRTKLNICALGMLLLSASLIAAENEPATPQSKAQLTWREMRMQCRQNARETISLVDKSLAKLQEVQKSTTDAAATAKALSEAGAALKKVKEHFDSCGGMARLHRRMRAEPGAGGAIETSAPDKAKEPPR